MKTAGSLKCQHFFFGHVNRV